MMPIERMRDAVEQYRDNELARARKRLARGDDPLEVMETLSRGLVAKLLHHPMRALNTAPPAERDALAGAVTTLFLDQNPMHASVSATATASGTSL
jgi:glutamyl-tRNA reductase